MVKWYKMEKETLTVITLYMKMDLRGGYQKMNLRNHIK